MTGHCLQCTLCNARHGVRYRFKGRWNLTVVPHYHLLVMQIGTCDAVVGSTSRGSLAARAADQAARLVHARPTPTMSVDDYDQRRGYR